MNNILKALLAALVAACLWMPGTLVAKGQLAPEMYVFGVAASFNDTIVHFTDIQTLDSAWVDSKTKFLLGRENYSYQLRDYISAMLNMPHRTCITFYGTNRGKLEKQYLKMLRLYSNQAKGKKGKQVRGYDVRHINQNQFRYLSVDMGDMVEQSGKKAQKSGSKARKKSAPHGGSPAGRTDNNREPQASEPLTSNPDVNRP